MTIGNKEHALISGDLNLIAKELGTADVVVRQVHKGLRGKRGSLLQVKIVQAIAFCEQKNREKIEYLQQLKAADKVELPNWKEQMDGLWESKKAKETIKEVVNDTISEAMQGGVYSAVQ